uniref:Major facilitator superfamily (MFS) profile domain-containing protein n=1 Tax=Chromera velia CCMP2878 TaxID=1169474 RepID=A0A0G4I2H2_9ALVE|eukprot:Cvel_35084.t1-p1 / transcript=Cvel_35084.t1 / gene=Cvel_35084 / organism=Chromera_velia_CCMP2878 / gene_product=Disrupted in renal carcinoma protein 2 homolog, putative / transcript_product=Disrupted in renal carcinoma protein 2 homolog, putative / location=Cvel_scaffold6273:1855-3322(+) / protein_length=237 / sequence_SO=supercontig / SO=protein_coding / is_pseudo=false
MPPWPSECLTPVLERSDGDRLELERGDGREETETATAEEASFTIYKRRWWVLFVFFGMSLLQAWMWALLGPLGPSYQKVADVSDNQINAFVIWGNAAALVVAFPAWYLQGTEGNFRWAFLLSMGAVFLGAVLRLFTYNNDGLTFALYNVSFVLNGCAGQVAMTGGTRLAQSFFPLSERVMAVAVSTEANAVGQAASYIFGPLLVPDTDAAEDVARDLQRWVGRHGVRMGGLFRIEGG